jgi:hypothetical protein
MASMTIGRNDLIHIWGQLYIRGLEFLQRTFLLLQLQPSATFNLLPQQLQIRIIERQQLELGIQFNRSSDSRLRLLDVTELAGIAPEVEVSHGISFAGSRPSLRAISSQ